MWPEVWTHGQKFFIDLVSVNCIKVCIVFLITLHEMQCRMIILRQWCNLDTLRTERTWLISPIDSTARILNLKNRLPVSACLSIQHLYPLQRVNHLNPAYCSCCTLSMTARERSSSSQSREKCDVTSPTEARAWYRVVQDLYKAYTRIGEE